MSVNTYCILTVPLAYTTEHVYAFFETITAQWAWFCCCYAVPSCTWYTTKKLAGKCWCSHVFTIILSRIVACKVDPKTIATSTKIEWKCSDQLASTTIFFRRR